MIRMTLRGLVAATLLLAASTAANAQMASDSRFGLQGGVALPTGDFGEIVYNLIKIGEMSKSASDRREDFDDVFDFDQALCREFAITKEE